MADEPAARQWLCASDDELIRQCAVDVYRASGPGGQKRNKTSSAVRLRHEPTGLLVIAEESRSQHENRARAVRRLRRAIALQLRSPVDPAAPPPQFYREALARDAALRVSDRHPDYWLILHFLLDVFAATRASVGDTADALGIPTGQLIRFLKRDDKLWAAANALRREHGQQVLR